MSPGYRTAQRARRLPDGMFRLYTLGNVVMSLATLLTMYRASQGSGAARAGAVVLCFLTGLAWGIWNSARKVRRRIPATVKDVTFETKLADARHLVPALTLTPYEEYQILQIMSARVALRRNAVDNLIGAVYSRGVSDLMQSRYHRGGPLPDAELAERAELDAHDCPPRAFVDMAEYIANARRIEQPSVATAIALMPMAAVVLQRNGWTLLPPVAEEIAR